MPLFAIVGSCTQLDQLRKPNPRAQAVMNCVEVRAESVRCNLRLSYRSLVGFFCKGHYVPSRPPSYVPRVNQLCVSLEEVKLTAHGRTLNVVNCFKGGRTP